MITGIEVTTKDPKNAKTMQDPTIFKDAWSQESEHDSQTWASTPSIAFVAANTFARFASFVVTTFSLLFVVCIGTAPMLQAAEFGDSRDKPGTEQKLLVPRELIPPSPALSADEAMKTFKIAPGFRLELVASEPLVGDPVAMTIGPDGRMWVVEMRSYMPDLDGSTEDAPVGRVVVLEDADGDGRMDKSTVFLHKLIMPRAILLAGDGVLIGAPPKLWFCRDKDGDGKSDEQTEVSTDFGVQTDPKRPELANPEHGPNSMLWALDNWIYSAEYTKRFRFSSGQWIPAPTTYRGQWGLSQDDFGHLFYNTNSDQMRADILPAHAMGRNPLIPVPAGVNVKVAREQFVWPIRVNPGINRGYLPEMLRDGKLKEFTAACAPWIYRGDLFGPQFYGNAFVCEPAGNLIKRNIVTEDKGTLTATPAYEQSEFLASTDERFRPVNLYTGPEGALYVVDFYRGVLQHRISLTTYLRKQSEERGLDKPLGLGRIYRIVPEGKSVAIKPAMQKETLAQWVEHLSHANSWWRETAQRLLVERNDAAVVPTLISVVTSGGQPLGRLHALCVLEGMGRLESSLVVTALKDADPRVRVAAVRVSEPFVKTDQRGAVLSALTAMAVSESAPLVQQQLALTLGEAADLDTDLALASLVRRAPDTAFLREAAISGLFGRELALLEKLLADPAWTSSDANGDKFLAALARCIFSTRKAEPAERLLGLATAPSLPAARAIALLDGIAATSATMAKKPVKFKTEPAALVALTQRKEPALRARTNKIIPLVTWPGKPGAAPEPIVAPLTAEQQARFDQGKALYSGICAACHQPHGLGTEGLAPPLVDSEWVSGSEQRLARIILQGLTGPIQVNGRTYRLDMPGLGLFTDEQIASILTYIRREWEHTANPVEPATIKSIREATKNRTEGWRQEELLKIP